MSNLLADFGWCLEQIGEPIVIVRARPQIMENGRTIGNIAAELIPAVASVQPATQSELEHLPEGLRAKGWMTYFGPVRVQTVDTAATRVADRVRYNGQEYQVESVDDWSQAGYYRASLMRLST